MKRSDMTKRRLIIFAFTPAFFLFHLYEYTKSVKGEEPAFLISDSILKDAQRLFQSASACFS